MKHKKPGGIRALQAVSITLSVVVLLVIGTIGYSGYMDYRGVVSELSSGNNSLVSGKITNQGSAGVLSLNITIPNGGVYTLDVSVSCDARAINVTCDQASVNVPAGKQEVLRFRMVIGNLAAYEASANKKINGTVAIQLEPFVSVSVGVDLGSLIRQGTG
ncbi:MAG TPA: hypothetical protein VFE91_04510 [Nitrososphaerales archaeon]|nr:hypothetical protein [Nitrososphaerales archaeon]